MPRKELTATILSGAALSAPIFLGAGRMHSIQMPASWTAAALTFQASPTIDGTYQDVYDGATELSVAVAASRFIVFDPAKFDGLRFLKIRSGTTGTPVNQGADRSLQVVTLPIAR